MSDPTEKKHVWFMRHGNPDFNYNTRNYKTFISMLTNGHGTPLLEEHNIDFASLPNHADLVCCSPALRSIQTVTELKKHVNVEWEMRMKLLDEVKFDKDIIREEEFDSLEKSRTIILTRWYRNENKAELFEQSMHRIKQIELFLSTRNEKNIVIVTHGWLLRLVDIYFVQGKKQGITLDDLLGVELVPCGGVIEATIKSHVTPYAGLELDMVFQTPQTAPNEHLLFDLH